MVTLPQVKYCVLFQKPNNSIQLCFPTSSASNIDLIKEYEWVCELIHCRYWYSCAEYCMGLKVNEKSDVYSFGVVVLELVSGKRATGEMEYGESLDIVGWIHSKLMSRESDVWGVVLYQEEEQGILDWRILQAEGEDGSSRCREKMLGMLKLGLMCTSSLPNRRPSMRQVLEILLSI